MSRILVLDRGNRFLKAALYDSRRIVRRWEGSTGGEWGAFVGIINSCAPDGVAFSSVVPGWTSSLRDELEERGIENVLEAGAGIALPFSLRVDQPEKVGPDRICAACGATAAGLEEAVIVDIGTAITVDVLSREGFLGGAIFPGPELLLRSLCEGTAVLPQIPDGQWDVALPGRNTEAAIIAGTACGLIGAVRELVNRSRRSLPPDAKILVTGGGALRIAPYLEDTVTIDLDLIFKGLYLLFELNLRGIDEST